MMYADIVCYLWNRLRTSEFVRRVFSAEKFRDSDARKMRRAPTVSDYADVDVRQVSGSEYVVVFSQGQQHLTSRLDSEMRTHQQKSNPILDSRPSAREVLAREMSGDTNTDTEDNA